MIRDEAAQKCAEEILDPWVKRDLCTPELVRLAAGLIKSTVKLDELAQQIEALERDREPQGAAS